MTIKLEIDYYTDVDETFIPYLKKKNIKMLVLETVEYGLIEYDVVQITASPKKIRKMIKKHFNKFRD